MTGRPTGRLVTEWSTDDPKIAASLRMIAEFSEYSLERMTLEAALHTWQAGWLQRRIGASEVHAADTAKRRLAAQHRRRPE